MKEARDPIRRVCLWSGPRNVSTALMYAFAQRSDTRIVDEPLYAHYLRVSGAQHPGRDVVLAGQDNDGEGVVRDVVLGPCERPVLFMKMMAHHLVELDLAFLHQTTNVILTRDPADMLRSLVHQVPEPQLSDTGLGVQKNLLEALRAFGQDPPVLDARELLRDPADVLEQLCVRLDLPFDDAMLSWPAGGNADDGVWAPFWYHNVHKSTRFQRYSEKDGAVPESLRATLAECQPCYDTLYGAALRPRSDASSERSAT